MLICWNTLQRGHAPNPIIQVDKSLQINEPLKEQAVNMFIFTVRLDISALLESASSGHERNCIFGGFDFLLTLDLVVWSAVG